MKMATLAFRTLDGVRFTHRARVNRTLIRETSISNRQNGSFGGKTARRREFEKTTVLSNRMAPGRAVQNRLVAININDQGNDSPETGPLLTRQRPLTADLASSGSRPDSLAT
jgi:hypothetical protein